MLIFFCSPDSIFFIVTVFVFVSSSPILLKKSLSDVITYSHTILFTVFTKSLQRKGRKLMLSPLIPICDYLPLSLILFLRTTTNTLIAAIRMTPAIEPTKSGVLV